jgi:arylsulfatase A-like enzyme
VVLFTSDNGSFMRRQSDPADPDHVSDSTVQAYFEGHHTANGPWRGTKADIWEGGHRVPYFARWPKVIRPGSKCDHTICHVDLFATAAELADTKLPPAEQAAPDSFSLVPLFRGNDQGFRRAPVIHHSVAGMFAIRDGQWKLVLGNGSGGREKPSGRRFETPWALFDLDRDPAESDNQASAEAEVAARLSSKMMLILADDKSRSK